MVRSGWALAEWHKTYKGDQAIARAERVGMWAGMFDRSRVWRKANRVVDKAPVDQYLIVNGLTVWELRGRDGRVYSSGARNYASVDELLTRYKIRYSDH